MYRDDEPTDSFNLEYRSECLHDEIQADPYATKREKRLIDILHALVRHVEPGTCRGECCNY